MLEGWPDDLKLDSISFVGADVSRHSMATGAMKPGYFIRLRCNAFTNYFNNNDLILRCSEWANLGDGERLGLTGLPHTPVVHATQSDVDTTGVYVCVVIERATAKPL